MILDTNAVSALLAGDETLVAALTEEPRHHLPVVVLGEYQFGATRSRHRLELEQALNVLVRESYVLAVDVRTAASYAEVRESLRARGRPIPENDVWIAALAVQHSLEIVSRDTYFDSVPNVTRICWQSVD